MLAVVAAGYGYIALHDPRPSGAQIHAATAALKHRDPQFMPEDPIFGDDGLWRLNLPLPQFLLRSAWCVQKQSDPLLPYRLATGVIAMIYLCGMYTLLYKTCRSWSVAVLVAVLSSKIAYSLGQAYWGAGSLGSATPQGLCIAVTPWLVFAYLRIEKRWSVLLVFLACGLLGNFQLTTAANVAAVLLLVYFVRGVFSPKRWLIAVLGLLLAAAGAGGAIWHYLDIRAAVSPAQTQIAAAAAFEALRMGHLRILFGEMRGSVVNWLLTVAVLAVPSAAVLFRAERFRAGNISFWLWMILMSLVVGLGLHSASLLFGVAQDAPPPVIDFVQATSLVMLPLYVLFATALTSLFRIARRHPGLVRWACAILLIGWMAASDNLRVARHQLLRAATVTLDEENRPRNVRRHRRRERTRDELTQIAEWAREKSDPNAVFLTDRIHFRMLSRRAITASRDDIRYVYYLAPDTLGAWHDLVAAQNRLFAGDLSAGSIRKFIQYARDQGLFEKTSQWYVVAPASPGPIDGLEEVPSDHWGRIYRLYRLP